MDNKVYDFNDIKEVSGIIDIIQDDYSSGALFILGFKDNKDSEINLGLEYEQLLDLYFKIKKELNPKEEGDFERDLCSQCLNDFEHCDCEHGKD